jgi:hypothetical protein
MKRAILIYLMMMFLFYILTSFVSWEFNPRNWSIDSRFMFSAIGSIFSGMIAAFTYQENN